MSKQVNQEPSQITHKLGQNITDSRDTITHTSSHSQDNSNHNNQEYQGSRNKDPQGDNRLRGDPQGHHKASRS